MPQVVGVKFRNSPKVYYFSPEEIEGLERDDFVIVETVRGQEAGIIAFPPCDIDEEDIPTKLKGILRRATALDLTEMERYRQQEDDALTRCREKVEEHGLAMKVISAEYNFDGSHLTFYFTADKRVDFRALVRELARTFKARIELHQIGVRDEVKLLGGHGLCGRPHCCATWMTEFRPISIRMAKQQDLPLSPMEISGVCGRLLCCLAYENDFYTAQRKRMPRAGSTIQSPSGEGRVTSINLLQETVTVILQGGVSESFTLEELDGARGEATPSQPRKGQRSKK